MKRRERSRSRDEALYACLMFFVLQIRLISKSACQRVSNSHASYPAQPEWHAPVHRPRCHCCKECHCHDIVHEMVVHIDIGHRLTKKRKICTGPRTVSRFGLATHGRMVGVARASTYLSQFHIRSRLCATSLPYVSILSCSFAFLSIWIVFCYVRTLWVPGALGGSGLNVFIWMFLPINVTISGLNPHLIFVEFFLVRTSRSSRKLSCLFPFAPCAFRLAPNVTRSLYHLCVFGEIIQV